MNVSRATTIFTGLALLLSTARCSQPSDAAPATPARPNIVLILLDDADVRDFAAYDPENAIAMPHIEAFAESNEVFDQFYANSPVCSPTRAAILTGQFPSRYGIDGIIRRSAPQGIPERAPMLAEALRARGYSTAHIGKWHLGTQRPEYLPSAKGFEHTLTTGTWRGYRNTEVFVDGLLDKQEPAGHLTERITDEAIAYLRAHQNERFFLNLWYFAPHVPLQPPAEWAKRHPATAAGRYAALLGYVDEQIGRVLSTLDALDLTSRTAILIASDNGGGFASHQARGTNLRGFKKELYEGGIRSPLLVHWPDRSAQSGRNPSVTATHDLMPTILDLLGEAPGEGPAPSLDGESFAQSLGGADRPRTRPLFWQFKPPNGALPHADGAAGYLENFAVRDGRWKLVLEGKTFSLFDLVADPTEQVDQRKTHPEIAARLLREYAQWRLDTSRLPISLTSLAEPVRTSEDSVRFDGAGAARADVAEPFDREIGDFSCRFRLQLERSGASQKLLGRGTAWELGLDDEQHLELKTTDDSGKTQSWSSELALQPERPYTVALAFASLQSGPLARVFVDGEVALVARALGQLRHHLVSAI